MESGSDTVLVTGGASGIGFALAERFLDEFADAVMPRIQAGELEVAYGFAQRASQASRQELEELSRRMNQPAG